MFGKKNKLIQNLKDKNYELRVRVHILEEKICPSSSHEWKKIDSEIDADGTHFYHYICKKCGRFNRTWQPLLEISVPNRSENE